MASGLGRLPSPVRCLVAALMLLTPTSAIQLDTTSASSIKDATSKIAYGMMKYYTGNNTGDTPGNLPEPYYWWEAGAMFGKMIEYWYYTGDTTYNAEVTQAMTWQAGTDGTFMPINQTRTEGNDDQVFWAFAAMAGAELGFPAPPDPYPSWLAMAQAVFNLQAGRWDTTRCGGGLRWQIFEFNGGYNYKNSVANGGFFFLASRLARYTGNSTYRDWADREYNWFIQSHLVDTTTWQINDGMSMSNNCTDADHSQWSYNYGLWMGGLAFLYNHTSDDSYLEPLQNIVNSTLTRFFPPAMGPEIMVEIRCEPYSNCDANGFTFKAYTSRWLALTAQMVPSLADTIWPYLETSAKGAAGQCDGGSDGITCGYRWNSTTWDGTYGVGQQMSALAIVSTQMLQVENLKPPLTLHTGGTSKSDPSAGTNTDVSPDGALTDPISTGDRAGAGILTAVCVLFTLGGAGWLVFGGPG